MFFCQGLVACRMAFWTWCSSRRPSIQFELAMDLILLLRVGRAAHQLFFVDVTVFVREQSEKREVRKSSTATEQETTPKSWSQTVQTTRRGCQTDRSKLHTPPAAIARSTVRSNRNFNFLFAKRRDGSPDHHNFRVSSNPVSRKFAYEFRFAKPPYWNFFFFVGSITLFRKQDVNGPSVLRSFLFCAKILRNKKSCRTFSRSLF